MKETQGAEKVKVTTTKHTEVVALSGGWVWYDTH